MAPVIASAEKSGNRVLTMAELRGVENSPLEAERDLNYRADPPSDEFMNWVQATDEYKAKHPPPIRALGE